MARYKKGATCPAWIGTTVVPVNTNLNKINVNTPINNKGKAL
jgi:hypothetical protein